MGHTHSHGHTHGHDGHHHADHGEAGDPKRYWRSGWVGVLGFLAEGGVGFFMAASVGAVSDALHALTDALSFFVSAKFAEERERGHHDAMSIEKVGVVFHTAFLAAAVAFIIGTIAAGKGVVEFNSGWMFAAGCLGLFFNGWQMWLVGRSRRQGMNLHEAVRQHAFYDLLYSCIVLHGSFLIFIQDSGLGSLAQAILATGIVAIFSLAFPSLGFVDFEGFSSAKKAVYVLSALAGAAASTLLVLYGTAKYIDLTAGGSLALAMVGSIGMNCYALATWGSGGHKLAHRH